MSRLNDEVFLVLCVNRSSTQFDSHCVQLFHKEELETNQWQILHQNANVFEKLKDSWLFWKGNLNSALILKNINKTFYYFSYLLWTHCTYMNQRGGGKKKRRKLDLRRDCQWWNTHSELPSSESEKHVSIFRTVEWRSQLQKVTAIRDLKDLFEVSMAKRSSSTTIFKTCVNELVTWELTFLRCANHTKNQLNFLRIKTLRL